MKAVETQVVTIDQVDDEAGTNPKGQSGHINYCVDFVAGNISPGDLEVVFQHDLIVLDLIRPIICQPGKRLSINKEHWKKKPNRPDTIH